MRDLLQSGPVDLPLLDLTELDQTAREALEGRGQDRRVREIKPRPESACSGDPDQVDPGRRYLPLLLFDPEDKTSVFSLQLLFESSQNRPVLPETDAQPGPGPGTT